jgi:predicted DNA-binding WGR domain protein
MALEIFEHSDFEKGEDKTLSLKIPKKRTKKAEFPAGTFTITDIKQAVKNPNRANIFVNGKYRFSLDIFRRRYIFSLSIARFWLENRNQRKGSSLKKLRAELLQKGVSGGIIEQVFAETSRNDSEEIRKIIEKKAKRYPDQQKLVAYLARQGFSFDEINRALKNED